MVAIDWFGESRATLSQSTFQTVLFLQVSEQELAERRAEQDKLGWKPVDRQREVSFALKLCQHGNQC